MKKLSVLVTVAIVAASSLSAGGKNEKYAEFCEALSTKADDGQLLTPVDGIKAVYKENGYNTGSGLYKVLSGKAKANEEVKTFLKDECDLTLS